MRKDQRKGKTQPPPSEAEQHAPEANEHSPPAGENWFDGLVRRGSWTKEEAEQAWLLLQTMRELREQAGHSGRLSAVIRLSLTSIVGIQSIIILILVMPF